jgi:CheY-like chemotaxis protein
VHVAGMLLRQARILVVDDPEHALSIALAEALAGHHVEIARDALDAIHRIDCAPHPYDLIFCDVSRGYLPGLELWAYLSIGRPNAAERTVFVVSTPLLPETKAVLARTPNLCVDLPVDRGALDALARRRATVVSRPSGATEQPSNHPHTARLASVG